MRRERCDITPFSVTPKIDSSIHCHAAQDIGCASLFDAQHKTLVRFYEPLSNIYIGLLHSWHQAGVKHCSYKLQGSYNETSDCGCMACWQQCDSVP